MSTVHELAPRRGIQATCDALGVPRASYCISMIVRGLSRVGSLPDTVWINGRKRVGEDDIKNRIEETEGALHQIRIQGVSFIDRFRSLAS